MEAVENVASENAPKRDGPPAEQLWFDVGDLGRRLKTSERHIYRMADNGRMPWGVKLGQLRRWSRREIEAWEATGCAGVAQRFRPDRRRGSLDNVAILNSDGN